MKINLKKVISEHKECLSSREKFRIIMSDLYPEEEYKKEIFLLSLPIQTKILTHLKLFDELNNMEVENFACKLHEEFGITKENGLEVVKEWANALGVKFDYENDQLHNRKIIEQEFEEAFNIVLRGSISGESCPFDYDIAVDFKRMGDYVTSNREYIRFLKEYPKVYAEMCIGWYKTLACSGDLNDALEILSAIFDRCKNLSNYHQAALMQHFYSLVFCIECVEGSNIFKYLSSISGNPNYMIKEGVFNIKLKSGKFAGLVNDIKTNSPGLYNATLGILKK